MRRALFFWTGTGLLLLLAGVTAAFFLVAGGDWPGVLLWLVTSVAVFVLAVRLMAPGLPESSLNWMSGVDAWFAFEEVSPVEKPESSWSFGRSRRVVSAGEYAVLVDRHFGTRDVGNGDSVAYVHYTGATLTVRYGSMTRLDFTVRGADGNYDRSFNKLLRGFGSPTRVVELPWAGPNLVALGRQERLAALFEKRGVPEALTGPFVDIRWATGRLTSNAVASSGTRVLHELCYSVDGPTSWGLTTSLIDSRAEPLAELARRLSAAA